MTVQDFPDGPMVKNLICNAGDTSSTPGEGSKIPPWGRAAEPKCHNTGAWAP